MLNELIDEIKQLQEYKQKYESQAKDKQKMSDELFKLMMDKYNNQTHEERSKLHNEELCRSCKFRDYCQERYDLPEDIWKPIEGEKAWIPGHTTCGGFAWS